MNTVTKTSSTTGDHHHRRLVREAAKRESARCADQLHEGQRMLDGPFTLMAKNPLFLGHVILSWIPLTVVAVMLGALPNPLSP